MAKQRTFTAEDWRPFVRGPETPLEDLIQSFLIARAADLSPRTIEGYGEYLLAFARSIGKPHLRELTAASVQRFIAERRRRAPFAARYAGAALKVFGTWLADNNYLSGPLGGSVLAAVKVPRVDRRREPFSDKEVDVMLRVLNESERRSSARDRAVILTFLGTGLRLNELREVRMTDLHIERPLERSYLFVRAETSKGGRSRRVRLDPMAANAVHIYLKDWRPASATTADPLFMTEAGKPFTYNGFQNYVRRIGDRFKAAGVEHWMAHRCRHYWATSNHRNGMTIFDIAAEGGWKDAEMVRRYTHDRPFEELQAMPTALTAMLRKRAS